MAMTTPKDKFAISMDVALRERIEAVAEARGEGRSTVIERLCRNSIEDEEAFLWATEYEPTRWVMEKMANNPAFARSLAKLVGQHLSSDELGKLGEQTERGRQRRQSKKKGTSKKQGE